MSVDARIFIKTRTGAEPRIESWLAWPLVPCRGQDRAPSGATHEIEPARAVCFYGRGYERGPWPEICAALLTLHSFADIEAVWYCSDLALESAPEFSPAPFTPEDVLVLSAHYMKHGERPYRDK